MEGISADGEVENLVDLITTVGVEAEQEPQMSPKDTGAEGRRRPSEAQTHQRTAAEDGAAEEMAASSSNCEKRREVALFSPGFSSAAAKAGWDAEALLIAALSRSPMDSGSLDASQTSRVDARKRDKHTPLSSSARRHRRFRLENKNGSPLGRLPMQPLTLLADNELESIAPANANCSISVAEGKENFSLNSLACNKSNNDSKGKKKEQTPTKPPCLDQLREELSCAVCLDICFEPSTVSCGHSFCGTCLQSVLQKCGPRCPKCRQPLRSEALRNYRINTVLWNTIQILFPKESAARKQEKQQQSVAEEAAKRASAEEQQSGRYLGTRPSRMQPWQTSAFNNVSQSNVIGNWRTSFQAASELMMPGSRVWGDDDGRRPSGIEMMGRRERDDDHDTRPSGMVLMGRRERNDDHDGRSSGMVMVGRRERDEDDSGRRPSGVVTMGRRRPSGMIIMAGDLSNEDRVTTGLSHIRSFRQTQTQAMQEQFDAELAARLQQAELNASSDAEDLLTVEEPREGSHAHSRPTVRRSPRTATVASAAANLRTVTQRATRQRRARIRS